jgi:DNA-binding transcriptional MerR regulator
MILGNLALKQPVEEASQNLLSIGEVAKKVGVEIHTIRFWTDEFESYLNFEIGKGNRRYYSLSSVETFIKINKLIHIDGIRIKAIKEKKMLVQSGLMEVTSFTKVKAKLLNAKILLEEAGNLLG